MATISFSRSGGGYQSARRFQSREKKEPVPLWVEGRLKNRFKTPDRLDVIYEELGGEKRDGRKERETDSRGPIERKGGGRRGSIRKARTDFHVLRLRRKFGNSEKRNIQEKVVQIMPFDKGFSKADKEPNPIRQ